ncbi:MAG: hypothetical protein JW860_12820 [Sedimentisphaerales bacterium]|nr:hypothetical protein [Sedimentisphaerales bacterium]
MIYDSVDITKPIKQGDIFQNIPRVDFSLLKIPIIEDDSNTRLTNWRDIIDETGGTSAITAIFPIKPVNAIVITQNCDAVRGEYLCLCQIDEYTKALNLQTPPRNPNKWNKLIIQHSKMNLRLFYLPADSHFGFENRMAADFRVILRVPRQELDNMRDLRVARLNNVGTEHFRESLGQFFRRYPYNEWYPLTKEEFNTYSDSCPESVKPYPWQK